MKGILCDVYLCVCIALVMTSYMCVPVGAEFGGEEEDLWEGPISEREKEEGGGRHDNNRDEL